MPLFPLDPPSSLYPLFWGWLSLCVKLCRGVITAPLEKGGAAPAEPGRCGCLNWPTSTERQQPDNYATTPKSLSVKGRGKTAVTGCLHPFTQLVRALPTMIRHVGLPSHLHSVFRLQQNENFWIKMDQKGELIDGAELIVLKVDTEA